MLQKPAVAWGWKTEYSVGFGSRRNVEITRKSSTILLTSTLLVMLCIGYLHTKWKRAMGYIYQPIILNLHWSSVLKWSSVFNNCHPCLADFSNGWQKNVYTLENVPSLSTVIKELNCTNHWPTTIYYIPGISNLSRTMRRFQRYALLFIIYYELCSFYSSTLLSNMGKTTQS